MVWRGTCTKPSPEPMLTQLIHAYVHWPVLLHWSGAICHKTLWQRSFKRKLSYWPNDLQQCHIASEERDTVHLTHWGRVTHICSSELTSIGSDNRLSPGRRQAIIWTSAGIFLFGPLGTNFSEILIEIHTFLFKKMHLKMSSGKCRPFCLGLSCVR